MVIDLGLPHSVPLMGLSLLLAVLGGYLGLGLAAQARLSQGAHRRVLLAGAAWALGLGIWTMHFVGILAAEFPADVSFSVLLTLMSFLLCVLVVGVAAFLQSALASSSLMTVLAAVFMGSGIVSMHYLGMHAISGPFGMTHDLPHIIAAAFLAIAASYAALRLLDTQLGPKALAASAVAFGLAVSGMHYTAMAGMTLTPAMADHQNLGLAISSDILTVAVAVLAFFISGFFLLYLVPEGRKTEMPAALAARAATIAEPEAAPASPPAPAAPAVPTASRPVNIPVETEGATRLISCDSVCALQATAHYTLVYDGQKEYLSPWSISEAEQKLPAQEFMRVHRSHIIALDKIISLKRSGDGAAVEVGYPVPRVVPVSRSHYAELKLRLGLRQKLRSPGSASASPSAQET